MLTFISDLAWGLDCPGADADKLAATVSHVPAIWPYRTGGHGIIWSPQQAARFTGARVYWVNQHFGPGGSDPMDGDEFDVEALAWTPAQCVDVTRARRAHSWSTRFYGTYATYDTVTSELAAAGIRRSTWWRIADWNLSQHLAQAELWGDVYAGQYASPSSNPNTLIPGTHVTLAEAHADLTALLKESTGWQG